LKNADTRHGMHLALKEHIASGNPVTRLEALVFFGVANLPDTIANLRKDGWVITKTTVSFAKAVNRINKHMVFKAPRDLPIREIQLTEYQATL